MLRKAISLLQPGPFFLKKSAIPLPALPVKPASAAHEREGERLLKEGKTQDAVKKFEDAVAADKNNDRAAFSFFSAYTEHAAKTGTFPDTSKREERRQLAGLKK